MPVVDPTVRRRRWFLDLSPLRDSPAYARFWIGGVASGIGAQLTIVAIGIHLYSLTGETAAVAAVGGFALVPMIIVGLIGGTLIDAYDRRRVLIIASSVAWTVPIGIAILAWNNVDELWPYYAFTTLSAASTTMVGTARFAIQPRLVAREKLPAAAALSGMSAGLQTAVGPALAGLLIALVGYAWTYTLDATLFLAGFLGIVTLPPIRPSGSSRVGLQSFVEGLRYLRSARNIRTAVAMQLATQILARPYALFPAIGTVLIGGGALTVGLLAASAAVGTILSGAVSGRFSDVRHHGTAMSVASAIKAVLIVAFGVQLLVLTMLPRVVHAGAADPVALAIACGILAAAGAGENISGIFRTTMLQSAPPDEVRGRLQGLFTLVLTAGPRLGDVFVGAVTAIGALWCPPVLGGIILLVVIAVLVARRPQFRHYDAWSPVA